MVTRYGIPVQRTAVSRSSQLLGELDGYMSPARSTRVDYRYPCIADMIKGNRRNERL